MYLNFSTHRYKQTGRMTVVKRKSPFAKQLRVRTQSIPLLHEKNKLIVDNETESG